MYNLTLGQNDHFSEKTQTKKNLLSFMPYGFSQSEHPFGQCGHFSQAEPCQKPCFFEVILKVHCYKINLWQLVMQMQF
jgi:hypothetical protein